MRNLRVFFLTLAFAFFGLITELAVNIFFGSKANSIYYLKESENALEIYILTLAPLVLIPVVGYVIKEWRQLSSVYYFAFLATFSLAAIVDASCAGSGKGMGCDAGSPSMALIYYYFIFIFLPASLLYFLKRDTNKSV